MTNQYPSELEPTKPSYTEDGFHDHYKNIQEYLRKFDTIALVKVCLRQLHAPAKTNVEYLQRLPWLLVLLAKWALLDKRAFKRGRPTPNYIQVNELLRLMHDLGKKGVARMPSQYEIGRLFLRTIGYQQFIYQREITLTAIARQQLYFGSTAAQDYIPATFLHLTGIDITRFLELSQTLLARFADRSETRITASWFSPLGGAYSEKEVLSFLHSISKSPSEIRATLLEQDKDNLSKGRKERSPAEYWEQTPFISYPLIRTGKDYVCWDRNILFRCVEHYVYSRLRSHNPKLFMAHFGPLFERYVEKAVKYMGLPFVPESALKGVYGEQSDAIDFIVVDAAANVFVDAKGAEMSYQGKAAHESSELAKWLETTALKAVKQAHKVIQKLPLDSDGDTLMRRRGRNYLIAVTYSELYVGNGRTLAEVLGLATLEPLMAVVPEEARIPLENMYFMTIRDFELLAEAVRSGKQTLTGLLDHAVAQDKQPHTQKFEFAFHLATANIMPTEPDYLVSKAIADIDALASCVSESDNS